ncbi:MAG: lipopolysaccharide biosynthesis protein [Fuerstiella sp.]
MSAPSLQSKTIRAAAWTASEQVGRRIFQFITGIILARILLPEEFGLMGVLTVFMIVAQVFADGGLSSGLIQNQESTDDDCCTVFYLNVFLGIVVCGVLCLVSPYVADAFHEPKLQALMCVLAFSIVVNSLGAVQASLFAKSIHFRPMTTAILISVGISSIVGITLALCGYGVWSLAIQRLVSDTVRVILFWLFSPWRPSLKFRLSSMKSQLKFGFSVLAAAICNTVTQPMYYFVIARFYSPAMLGFVTQGNQLPDAPSKTLSGLVNRVAYPVFSSIQNDPTRVQRGLQRALKLLYSTVMPLMAGLAVMAPQLVSVLLTDKWLPSVPYLRLMCAIGFLMPVQTLHQHLLMADGRTSLLLKTQVTRVMLHALCIFFTYQLGIVPLIWCQIIVEFAIVLLLCFVNGVKLQYPLVVQLRDATPSIGMVILMSVAMLAVGRMAGKDMLTSLAAQSLTGLTVFTLMGNQLRLSPFTEAQRFLKRQPA